MLIKKSFTLFFEINTFYAVVNKWQFKYIYVYLYQCKGLCGDLSLIGACLNSGGID